MRTQGASACTALIRAHVLAAQSLMRTTLECARAGEEAHRD